MACLPVEGATRSWLNAGLCERIAIHVCTNDRRENCHGHAQRCLATERSKRQVDEADAATRQQIGRAVLEALAERLNAEPLPGWLFTLDGQEIRVFRIQAGGREQVGTWTVDNEMRLVTGDQMTEWITVESAARVMDEAL